MVRSKYVGPHDAVANVGSDSFRNDKVIQPPINNQQICYFYEKFYVNTTHHPTFLARALDI